MKNLSVMELSKVNGGNLNLDMVDCYQAKADAIHLLLGPNHYDVLDVTHSLYANCPMEYPDKVMALHAAIEPFMMNPNLI